jgi:regulator of protease activity HflC (stomatin/prohibitin superfamily)
MAKLIGGIVAVIVLVLGISTIFGSFYAIDQGERGVLLRNGAVTGTAEPGLGYKLPFIEGVVEISVQSRSRLYENVEAYSRDQQLAALKLSVNYRIPPDQVEQVYAQYGGEEGVLTRLVDRRAFELTKTVFGQFNAETAIRERGRLNAEVASAIQSAVVGPVIIESVQIEDISFSAVYEQSIETRMLAEVEVQRRQQELAQQRVQAEITVTQAQAAADARLAEAEATAAATLLAGQAQADVTRLAGEAEAFAIRAKGDALRDNPELVHLITAESWNGQLPTTMVPSGAVPFINAAPAVGR